VAITARVFKSRLLKYRLLRRYATLVTRDLSASYSRDTQKWLLVAPIIGTVTGLVITGLSWLILNVIWSRLLPYYFAHHWAIAAGLLAGFFLTGVIMRYRTPNPNEHSTDEIIRSYHQHQGDIDMRAFWWKLLASVTTVGSGGSAALEGPGIYGGGAIGSWLWTKLGRFDLKPRDRRIALISGAAAGLAAVFRAPLTGLVFALEMPYKDDLAHEALLPSLISSAASYATLVAIVGSQPLFGFVGAGGFKSVDIFWSAVLGAIIGLVALVYDIAFRQVREVFVMSRMPHVVKLVIGGLGTAVCGIAFVDLFRGPLIPIGPNYEAVRQILAHPHPSPMLLVFAAFKLLATMFSIGSGGVSAVFVPLLLVGGCIGNAFGQSIAHAPAVDLYAAVGMAAFLAAGYKTPLTAVVFVAETTSQLAYLIPSLIGAALAYAVSGDASVSGDQLLRETVKIGQLAEMTVGDVMCRQVKGVSAGATLQDFADHVASHRIHTVFPVYEAERAVGLISVSALTAVAPERWAETPVGKLAMADVAHVTPDCDLAEALRLLVRQNGAQMLLVTDADGELKGIVTKTDILRGLADGGRDQNAS
jgi:chloride channel protein, CIC family